MRKDENREIWRKMRFCIHERNFVYADQPINSINDFNAYFVLKQVPEIQTRCVGTRKSNNPEWDALFGGIPILEEYPTGKMLYTRNTSGYSSQTSYWQYFNNFCGSYRNNFCQRFREWCEKRCAQGKQQKRDKENLKKIAISLKKIELGIKPMTAKDFLFFWCHKHNCFNHSKIPRKVWSEYYKRQDFELKKQAKENNREYQREKTRERKKMDLFLATQNLVKG